MAAGSLDDMLTRVLDAVLDVFDCDRAWLIHPCVRDAPSFRVRAERTRAQWSGAAQLNVDLPLDDYNRMLMSTCLDSADPVAFEPGHNALDPHNEISERFHIRSQLTMALRPRDDDAWALGIHHCEAAHSYSAALPLFRAIGNRLADGVTTMTTTRRLQQSEERFRTLVEHAPEAIVILDAGSGMFIEANAKAINLFGLDQQTLRGNYGPLDLSPERQPDGQSSAVLATHYVQQALAGGYPTFEWTHRNAEGESVSCEVCLARLPSDPDRQLLRGSITDISERKLAERQRADLETRLAQAQKMEAIGQLTGGIAHDFNNILTVILGNLELMTEFADDREALMRYVQDASTAAAKASDLTHRLLAFARRQPLRPTSLDALALLHGMQQLLERTLGESIEVVLELGADLWMCEADGTQLEQAILNLAINARDAMGDRGRLTIRAANANLSSADTLPLEDVAPGEYVLLQVIDTGTGIAPEIQPEIFSPFFTTKEVGKGSGLGLSMVYGFVKQSRGHIRADSELGNGATISIYLPRSFSTSAVDLRTGTVMDIEPGAGEHILVVEDESQVRSLARELLTRTGYVVHEAADAGAALEVLAREPIDLLLTDVILPGDSNGPELARVARSRTPDLSVLFMSGYSRDAIRPEDDQLADVELVAKPFTGRTLAARVRAAIDGA